MANAYRIVKFAVIAAAGFVSIGTERGLKPHIPAGYIKGVRHGNAALDEVIAKMIRIDGQFDKWEQSQRKETAVVATDVQFEAGCNSVKTGLVSNGSGVEILDLFRAKGGEDQLKIEIVKQAGFDVYRRD